MANLLFGMCVANVEEWLFIRHHFIISARIVEVTTEVKMKYKTTPYILEKDGVYYSFQSEKDACDFLGVRKSCVASAYRQGYLCHGFRIIKPLSENDIYHNKRLRKIWSSMHERCEYEKHPHYHQYGGRGIRVCDEWSEYIPFAKWAFNNGYKDDLTIDRIDPNGIYAPNNCRWATMKEQQNNRRNNHIIVYESREYTLTELAEKIGMNKTTLKERLNLGWSIEDAVNRPVRLRTKGWRMSNCGAKMAKEGE